MNPLDNLPPELALEQAALLRRQQIANALLQRGMAPRPTQMAGRVAVQQSPLEGVASLANIANARGIDNEVLSGMKGLSQRYRDQIEKDFNTFSGEPDRKAAVKRALISQNPQIRKLAELEFASMNKPIDKVDAGDKWILYRGETKIGEVPKSATPDAVLREGGAIERHATPSGDTLYRHNVVSAGDLMRDNTTRWQHQTVSGNTAATNATTRRGQDITAATARRGQDLDYSLGTDRLDVTRRGQDMNQVGTGFRPDGQGGAVPIPGTKQGNEAIGADVAADTKIASANEKFTRVTSTVDEALKQTKGWTSTGLSGGLLQYVPGSDAFNLARTVDTIKANIGFDALQAMREASPTGGALGQVAVQELNALQASVASLDVGQDRKQLEGNLRKVTEHYNNWKRVVDEAYKQRPRVTPMPGNGIKFLGYE